MQLKWHLTFLIRESCRTKAKVNREKNAVVFTLRIASRQLLRRSKAGETATMFIGEREISVVLHHQDVPFTAHKFAICDVRFSWRSL